MTHIMKLFLLLSEGKSFRKLSCSVSRADQLVVHVVPVNLLCADCRAAHRSVRQQQDTHFTFSDHFAFVFFPLLQMGVVLALLEKRMVVRYTKQ